MYNICQDIHRLKNPDIKHIQGIFDEIYKGEHCTHGFDEDLAEYIRDSDKIKKHINSLSEDGQIYALKIKNIDHCLHRFNLKNLKIQKAALERTFKTIFIVDIDESVYTDLNLNIIHSYDVGIDEDIKLMEFIDKYLKYNKRDKLIDSFNKLYRRELDIDPIYESHYYNNKALRDKLIRYIKLI